MSDSELNFAHYQANPFRYGTVVDRINRIVDYLAIASSLHGSALGLLRCHSIVTSDVASIFNGIAIFSFLGSHNWYSIISWLKEIAPQNRNHLTKLAIDIPCPMHVWLESDGLRVEASGINTSFQRHPCLQLPERPLEVIMENNNPSVENLSEILGPTGPELNICFLPRYGYISGYEIISYLRRLQVLVFWHGLAQIN